MNNKDKFLNALSSIFETKDIKLSFDDKFIYSHDWSRVQSSEPTAVVFPTNTEQLIEVVKLCNSYSQPFIGSGGRTGLSGGATSIADELIISFDKMNKIIDFNETDKTLVCQPGLITKQIQDFASENNLFYPVEFSSTGSSHIGGNIATNAGGIKVIKYGLTADYVNGLEVIGGDGKFYNFDKNLIKNATGPNLKNLFIGSEGIFGLLAKCNIRLIDKPHETTLAIIGFDDIENLNEIRKKIHASNDIEAMEFFTNESSKQVNKVYNKKNPLGFDHNYYLIIEYVESRLQNIFGDLLSKKLVEDIIISQSDSQKKQIWDIRMLISESIYLNQPIKYDIAVPLNKFSNLVYELETFAKKIQKLKPILFGHVGDGNLHVNFLFDTEKSRDEAILKNLDMTILRLVRKYKGTISAEHGIGYLKKEMFKKFALKHEISVLKSIKKKFDPNNLLNLEKVIP